MNDNNDNNYGQKYNELGGQIRDSVMDAIGSGDFTGLSETISQSVYTVLGDVGSTINKAATQALNNGSLTEGQKQYRAELERAREEARQTAARYHQEQQERIERNKAMRAQMVRKPNPQVRFRNVGMTSGTLSIIGGSIGAGITGVTAVGSALAVMAGGAAIATLAVSGAFLAAFVGMIVNGVNKVRLSDTARKYKSLCSQKMYCAVDDIASATGTSQKDVVKNIKKMLAKGFFPEGYIDDECTTFMVSQEVYNQYVETKKNQLTRSQEILESSGVSEENVSVLTPEQQRELSIMMAEGQRGINRIHELNNEIPGEAITSKLNSLESLLAEIFDRVREHPEQMKSCHKLMDYYLPTMIKLVEAYEEYDKVSAPGPDILRAKEEIEKTLDTINQAFVELLNKLFRDSVWDVTADAKVLKTMLKQEGLASDELN